MHVLQHMEPLYHYFHGNARQYALLLLEDMGPWEVFSTWRGGCLL